MFKVYWKFCTSCFCHFSISVRTRSKKKKDGGNVKFSLVDLMVGLRRVRLTIILIVRFGLYTVSVDTDTRQHLFYGVAINQKQSQNKQTVTWSTAELFRRNHWCKNEISIMKKRKCRGATTNGYSWIIRRFSVRCWSHEWVLFCIIVVCCTWFCDLKVW